ncbi:MAG: hypothetical protein AAF170_02475 [Bacteroidota bacterium]
MTDALPPVSPRRRWYRRPVVIVIGSVLLGMVLGALLTGLFVRHRLLTVQSMFQEEGFEAVFFEAVNPTEAQREAIRPILSDAFEAAISNAVEFRGRMQTHADTTLEALDEHLDDGQMERARFLLKVIPDNQMQRRLESAPEEVREAFAE